MAAFTSCDQVLKRRRACDVLCVSLGANPMRPIVIAAIFGLAVVSPASADVSASVSVKARTVTYSISGKDGNALLDAMDRRGPKHGFLTRAIAQTSYTVSWTVDWKEQAGACRVTNADATLSITYTYPQVKGTMPPNLQRRWVRFIAGVRKHEETHGQLARQMVGAAEKSLKDISYATDPRCRKTKAELKKRIALIYAKYEARQVEFDRVEHGEGGNVERLVTLLGKGK